MLKPAGLGELAQSFVVSAEHITPQANIDLEGLVGNLHHGAQTVMSVPVLSHEVDFEFHAAISEVEHAHALVPCVSSS